MKVDISILMNKDGNKKEINICNLPSTYLGCNNQNTMKAMNCDQPKEPRRISECRYEYRCKTCGCTYEVDSGD